MMTEMTRKLLQWLHEAAESGEIAVEDGLDRVAEMATERLGFIVPPEAVGKAAGLLHVSYLLRAAAEDPPECPRTPEDGP